MNSARIVIIGAGVAGICAAVRLQQAGFRNVTMLERSDEIGGTWRDNSYPGAACDVPSHLYSYSFAPKPDWSRLFARQDEIREYLEQTVDRYQLRPRIRHGVEVTAAAFDQQTGTWRIATTTGDQINADVVISALGQLSEPRLPEIDGLDRFAGAVFHTARWRHDHDLTGRRVAVIGSAASAVQVVPEITPLVGHLDVYQRTANWIIPRLDRCYTENELARFRRLPGSARLHRAHLFASLESQFASYARRGRLARRFEHVARDHLHGQITDRRLRAALTPDYPIGCKRVLITDDYYPALTRPNVEFVTRRIDQIATVGVVTDDGATRPADTIILATGFHTTDLLARISITGRDDAQLADAWRHGPVAHLGVTVSGFPNLFLLYGPNTNLGHGSIIFMIECQAHYIVRALQTLAARGGQTLDVRPDAQLRSNARLQRALRRSSWAGSCASWYKTPSGRITQNWSGTMLGYWLRTRRPLVGDFTLQETAPRHHPAGRDVTRARP
jgi:cation diffusion facilitator CzcD-associated flavoprotein CzcO